MKRYALSIVFAVVDGRLVTVVLKKLRGPEGVVGRTNFPGGHIEPGESAQQAAGRELLEETGVVCPESAWSFCGQQEVPGVFALTGFAAEVTPDALSRATSCTDEVVSQRLVLDLLESAQGNPAAYAEGFEGWLRRAVIAAGVLRYLR